MAHFFKKTDQIIDKLNLNFSFRPANEQLVILTYNFRVFKNFSPLGRVCQRQTFLNFR